MLIFNYFRQSVTVEGIFIVYLGCKFFHNIDIQFTDQNGFCGKRRWQFCLFLEIISHLMSLKVNFLLSQHRK